MPEPAAARVAMPKTIGVFGVFSIAAGSMISSGLFVLPGLAFSLSGPAVAAAYALAALLMVPLLFACAELATAIPKSGGSYVFVERSMGPFFGSVAGLVDWFSITLKASFALVGLGALTNLVIRGVSAWDAPAVGFGLAWCAVFTLVNIRGTRMSGRLQDYMVVGLLGIVAIYAIWGIGFIDEARYVPFAPHGREAVLAVAAMVFVSYGGINTVVAVSEEVQQPTRSLPRGMFLAGLVVSLLYAGVVFVTVGVVDAAQLAGSLTPLGLGAQVMFGPTGALCIEFAAFLAFATTANAGILTAARSPMAMSRDGLFPEAFSDSNRHGAPVPAILLTAVTMGGLVTALDIESLAKTASALTLLMFLLINAAVIIMRYSGIANYRPTFHTPLFPWLPGLACVIYAVMILGMGTLPLAITGAFVAFCGLWYLVYVRTRIERQSALLFMVKRMMSRHIGPARLDEELVGVLLERDGVEFDRFDHHVAAAPVVDIPERIDAREFFRRISAVLADRVRETPEELYDLFLARERESSTVIQPGLAIPHVVVPGTGVFEIALVRCREGAAFDDLHEPVHIAFAIVGSADERNYHLRALMNIAQIVQERQFLTRWQQAHTPEQLRAILHLARRSRDARPA